MILLTPGPLTTRPETRQAMLEDWGSRDPAFIALTAELRRRLLALSGGETTHVCIPIQGSGTYVVEAAIGSLTGSDDRLLVLEKRTSMASGWAPLPRAWAGMLNICAGRRTRRWTLCCLPPDCGPRKRLPMWR